MFCSETEQIEHAASEDSPFTDLTAVVTPNIDIIACKDIGSLENTVQ